MQEKIYINWEDESEIWQNSKYIWDDVSFFRPLPPINKKCIKWEEGGVWNNVNYLWNSYCIDIETAVRGGGGYAEYVKNNPWDKLRRDIGEEKTKKVIKLYCKVNNIEYEKVVENVKDIKVTANEFENFVKDGISVKVNI